MQQDAGVLFACLKRYLKLCSWSRRNFQKAPDAKRAIKKKKLYSERVNCVEIIVFSAWSTYFFSLIFFIAILIFVLKSWVELIYVGLNTINPMFTGSTERTGGASGSHVLLPAFLFNPNISTEIGQKWKVIITQVTSVPRVGISRLYMIFLFFSVLFLMLKSGYSHSVSFVHTSIVLYSNAGFGGRK